MTELNLNNVNLVLIDNRNLLRNNLRMALNDAGIVNNNIEDGADMQTLVDAMHPIAPPDLLICDSEVRGGDIFETLTAIRHNELGENPFIGIIVMGWNPTAKLVDQAMNAGSDFMVAAPVSPQQLIDRIRAIVHNRPPFVVTSDYVGPDRRDLGRVSDLPLIEAPNTLRAKVLGEFEERPMLRAIDQGIGFVNECKLEQHAYTLVRITTELAEEYAKQASSVNPASLKRLTRAAIDLRRRALRSRMTQIADLCTAFTNALDFVLTTPPEKLAREVELMKQLSLAIRGAVQLRHENPDVAHDIASSVTSRNERQPALSDKTG